MSNDKKQTTDTVKPLKPLTRKQQVFVKHLVTHPKESATAAARVAYNLKTNKNAASSIASENMRKPEIQAALAQYQSKAEYNLMILADKSTEIATKTMAGTKEGAAYASVSERVNNSIIDRLQGKATQRTEVTGKVVTLNVDLTGVTDGNNPSRNS